MTEREGGREKRSTQKRKKTLWDGWWDEERRRGESKRRGAGWGWGGGAGEWWEGKRDPDRKVD